MNSVKQDPSSKWVAVRTGFEDERKQWAVVNVADMKCHYVAEADVSAWAGLVRPSVPLP
jgi:hypothetical protein